MGREGHLRMGWQWRRLSFSNDSLQVACHSERWQAPFQASIQQNRCLMNCLLCARFSCLDSRHFTWKGLPTFLPVLPCTCTVSSCVHMAYLKLMTMAVIVFARF